MLPEVRLVYPYYRNPVMLERQVENWSRLAGDLKKAVRVVLVDDHSPEPALPIFEKCTAKKSLYRFSTPGLWTMHEARNLGGLVDDTAQTNPWLLMSDIDLIITPEELYKLLEKELDPGKFYMFQRKMAPDFTDKHPHCNSFLVKQSVFKHINGYDADFCGAHGGGYGGDGEFIRQLKGIAPMVQLEDVTLIGHEREAVADANTTDWDRDEWKKKYREVFDRKRHKGDMRSINPIRREWEKLI